MREEILETYDHASSQRVSWHQADTGLKSSGWELGNRWSNSSQGPRCTTPCCRTERDLPDRAPLMSTPPPGMDFPQGASQKVPLDTPPPSLIPLLMIPLSSDSCALSGNPLPFLCLCCLFTLALALGNKRKYFTKGKYKGLQRRSRGAGCLPLPAIPQS